MEEATESLSQMVARPYLRTPRAKIIQTTQLLQRKQQDFLLALSRGLIPDDEPSGFLSGYAILCLLVTQWRHTMAGWLAELASWWFSPEFVWLVVKLYFFFLTFYHCLGRWSGGRTEINPLSANISMHILLSVLSLSIYIYVIHRPGGPYREKLCPRS